MPRPPRPLSALLCALAAVLAGCGESPPEGQAVGAFRVRWLPDGFSVAAAAAPDRPLLESYRGVGAYAPAAARSATALWQEAFGQFKVTEGQERWSEGVRLSPLPGAGARAELKDDLDQRVAVLEATSPAEGALLLEVKAAPLGPSAPPVNRLSLAFRCAPGDRFLGFGEQSDALDHRGHKVPLWTSEPGIGKSDGDDPPELWFLLGARHGSSLGLPTWLSNRGYVGALETARRSNFELCSARDDAWRAEVWDGALRLWLWLGPAPAQALARATQGLLGRQARPEPLVFAPWNDALFGSANVRRVAQLLRDRKIPSSVIWSEDFRGGVTVGADYQLTDEYELDRALYPDAEAVARDLHAGGYLWLAYFFTFAVQGTRAFPAAQAGGHLIRTAGGAPYLFDGSTFLKTSLVDLSSPAARAWLKGYLFAALDQGFDGWMADFGEWLPHDALLASGEDGLAAHNRYPAEWSLLSAEALAERETGRPRVFFSRSGWFGSQARTPVHWPGDQSTDFKRDDGLPTIVPMALNLGLAGWSTTGSDVGGYQTATAVQPTTKELFFRWAELGALQPVLRTHHTRSPARAWQLDHDEETLRHWARWAGFHTRLFPYLDAGALEHERTGLPLMRALPLAYPEDEAGWAIADQYLLGPALLVAPVQEDGARSRRLHVPPGRWLPWDGGPALEGPSEVTVAAPLEEVPLFARAGSVVPLLRERVDTLLVKDGLADLRVAQSSRTLRVFAGGEAVLEERDGARYALVRDAAAGATLREAGAALPACATALSRGCLEPAPLPDGAVRVRLSGQGPLSFQGHRLELRAPDAGARPVDVEVRLE